VAARDAEALNRILVIDDRVPHYDRGSGDPRMAKLLEELVGFWPDARITLLAADGHDAERYAEPLLERGIEVVTFVDWGSWFDQRLFHYSLAIVSRAQNADRFGELLRWTQRQALRVFDTEALTFRRLERQAGLVESREEQARIEAEAARLHQVEVQAVYDADAVFCVSPEEEAFVQQVAPGKLTFVLPGYVEAADRPPGFDERRDLVFFGGFLAGAGSPNEDALLYLVKEVLPAFWELEPDAVLHVVGADVTPAVRGLEGPRVNVVGFVEDPREWLDRARVHLNPMRFGAGVKQKFLDTMAAGLPLVTTTVGAEGLVLGRLTPLVVADEPADLARLAHSVYADRAAWETVQAGVLDLARSRFDRATFQQTLLEAMSHLGLPPPPRSPLLRARETAAVG
jgi:glycosyltransferase involved in cell wall biosynthesis